MIVWGRSLRVRSVALPGVRNQGERIESVQLEDDAGSLAVEEPVSLEGQIGEELDQKHLDPVLRAGARRLNPGVLRVQFTQGGPLLVEGPVGQGFAHPHEQHHGSRILPVALAGVVVLDDLHLFDLLAADQRGRATRARAKRRSLWWYPLVDSQTMRTGRGPPPCGWPEASRAPPRWCSPGSPPPDAAPPHGTSSGSPWRHRRRPQTGFSIARIRRNKQEYSW